MIKCSKQTRECVFTGREFNFVSWFAQALVAVPGVWQVANASHLLLPLFCYLYSDLVCKIFATQHCKYNVSKFCSMFPDKWYLWFRPFYYMTLQMPTDCFRCPWSVWRMLSMHSAAAWAHRNKKHFLVCSESHYLYVANVYYRKLHLHRNKALRSFKDHEWAMYG